ncbi:unnamed protein product [Adineta ricciae]|uniref:Uncharacterized protein n=1 Tax=Adineta ricciae TaxID=249248 RepID=A0A813QW82_ADIRI|nr:unnamed protein product [Adineta ricciae]CAF0774255.1 unnamed protein product [Adineta ricciae]
MPPKKRGFFSRGSKQPSQPKNMILVDDDDPTPVNWPANTPMVPTGAVDIDESVQLPTHTVQPNTDQNHGQVHLPPISQHQYNTNHVHDHYHPDNSSRLSAKHQHSHHHHHHHSGRASLPLLNHDHNPDHGHHHHEHQPVEHHQHHEHEPVQHHHEHEHHRHHNNHQQQHHHHEHGHTHRTLETFDPRWWYLNTSVHAPKSWRAPEYHYVSPKWYESPRRYYKILKQPEDYTLPPRLHIDCRCLVCRPPREKTRGIKWVLNQ